MKFDESRQIIPIWGDMILSHTEDMGSVGVSRRPHRRFLG